MVEDIEPGGSEGLLLRLLPPPLRDTVAFVVVGQRDETKEPFGLDKLVNGGERLGEGVYV